MLDHAAAILALHARAATLSVATTGSTTLAATTTGYTRATGSFITDGFAVGMEVVPTGFLVNTTPDLIMGVTATTLTMRTAMTAESAASGRTLAVGYPTQLVTENVHFEPTPGRWYVDEQYVPGPGQQITLGPGGLLEVRPMFICQLMGIAKTGPEALYAVADALLTLFPPHQGITLSTGDVLLVRTDVIPYRSQLQPAAPGWATVSVTVPLRVRTPNTI